MAFTDYPNPEKKARHSSLCGTPKIREVLHGVGADGVGVKFAIFAVIAVGCPCPLGEAEKSEEKGEKCVKKAEKW